jgi:hypothetical protein
MADNARVAWVEVDRPWTVEKAVLERLSLPLNIDGNGHHPFCQTLRELRRRARAHARALDVRSDW